MHPFAFLLPLAIFLHFCILGKAFIVAVRFPGPSLRSWLISPALGFSLQILIVSIINQAGYPVEKFGRWEAIILSALAIGVLAWKRPSFNLKLLAPFMGVALLVLVYTGWPLLKLGLGWFSYCNDDMANYCLAAMRSLQHGFFDLPTVEELISKDYAQCYWFLHVANLMRYGSELLLTEVTAATGINAINIFMPTTIALGMSMPLATAALMRANHSKYKTMLLAAVLLSWSPLFLLGIFYQLIAQVAGLTLLCSTAALLITEKISWARRSALIRYAIVLGILGAALCITYPEITPFCGLGFFLWVIIKSIREKKFFWLPIAGVFFVGLIVAALLRYNVLTYLRTLQEQVSSGSHSLESDLLFPYFLVPSGLSALFGFSALADQFENIEKGYFYFFLAMSSLIFFSLLVVRSLRRGRGAACIAVIMIGMGARLFYKNVGFGLFKLAMFIQPFIAIELALFFSNIALLPCLLGVGVYCLLQFPIGVFYGVCSLGQPNARFVSIPQISESDFEIEKNATTTRFNLRSSHIVIEKLTACLFDLHNQNSQSLEVHVPFESIMNVPAIAKEEFIKKYHPYGNEIFLAKDLAEKYSDMFYQRKILGTDVVQQVSQHVEGKEQEIRPMVGIEPLNQLQLRTNKKTRTPFFQQQYFFDNDIYLTFIASNRGEHFYGFKNLKNVSFYQSEKDPFWPTGSIAGIGRFFLFRVDDSSQPIYLRLAATRSILGDNKTALFKNAIVKGKQDVSIELEGDGAANCYVGPITPVNIDGVDYIAVDFGEDGQPLSKSTKGIMGFYGEKRLVDPRYLVGYARDISAISAEEYKRMDRPREIKNFPKDLVTATTLEFSGWYEDGWISQNSYVILGPAQPGDSLVVKGVVPGIGSFISKDQEITVLVNGVQLGEKHLLKPGPFALTFPLSAGNEKKTSTKVELVFSSFEKLTAPDCRPAAAKIDYLGIGKAK